MWPKSALRAGTPSIGKRKETAPKLRGLYYPVYTQQRCFEHTPAYSTAQSIHNVPFGFSANVKINVN